MRWYAAAYLRIWKLCPCHPVSLPHICVSRQHILYPCPTYMYVYSANPSYLCFPSIHSMSLPHICVFCQPTHPICVFPSTHPICVFHQPILYPCPTCMYVYWCIPPTHPVSLPYMHVCVLVYPANPSCIPVLHACMCIGVSRQPILYPCPTCMYCMCIGVFCQHIIHNIYSYSCILQAHHIIPKDHILYMILVIPANRPLECVYLPRHILISTVSTLHHCMSQTYHTRHIHATESRNINHLATALTKVFHHNGTIMAP